VARFFHLPADDNTSGKDELLEWVNRRLQPYGLSAPNFKAPA
jgi:hypothetical protein